jgi:NAD-dependent DNA ligase
MTFKFVFGGGISTCSRSDVKTFVLKLHGTQKSSVSNETVFPEDRYMLGRETNRNMEVTEEIQVGPAVTL